MDTRYLHTGIDTRYLHTHHMDTHYLNTSDTDEPNFNSSFRPLFVPLSRERGSSRFSFSKCFLYAHRLARH